MLTSPVQSPKGGAVEFNICRQCRRFWLERDGWLLSKRETLSLLKGWPEAPLKLAR
ncbi:MAG TPA: hypothetical protein VGB83_01325 [Actinomycetota bacterium]